MADGRAEEDAAVVCHLEKPAGPASRIAANLRIGEVAHHRQRLVASG
jgi:hypothetical protein